MPIAGDRPETGVRIVVERNPSKPDAPWTYAGTAYAPDASFPIAATVDGGGKVTVTVSPGDKGAAPPPDLTQKVLLIVRSVYRQATADGEPPPWRIHRWRGEK